MAKLTLYTRAGCHLCERALQTLEAAQRRSHFELEVIDIDTDPELKARYNEDVPVIAIDGRHTFQYFVSEEELIKRLTANK